MLAAARLLGRNRASTRSGRFRPSAGDRVRRRRAGADARVRSDHLAVRRSPRGVGTCDCPRRVPSAVGLDRARAPIGACRRRDLRVAAATDVGSRVTARSPRPRSGVGAKSIVSIRGPDPRDPADVDTSLEAGTSADPTRATSARTHDVQGLARGGASTFYVGLEADNSKAYWQAHKAVYDESSRRRSSSCRERDRASEFGPLRVVPPEPRHALLEGQEPVQDRGRGGHREPGRRRRTTCRCRRTGLYVGSGYYHLMPDQLERFRAAVADNRTGPKLATAVDRVRKQRYNVDARESLKRVPRGYDADHPARRPAHA